MLALLLGALSLFAAAPAEAQTTVWSATLTADVDDTNDYFGCDNDDGSQDNCSLATVLTDDDFTHGGTTYSITGLYWRASTDQLILALATGGSQLLSSAAKTALSGVTLNVEGTALAVSDSIDATAASFAASFAWSYDPAVNWTDGREVSLSLTSAQTGGTPAASTLAAPTNLGVAAGNAQLGLTWTAPSGTVTGYDVHYTSAAASSVSNTAAASGNNPATAWVAVTRTETDPPTASQTISSLTNNTSYRVRVRAKNSDGNVNGEWAFGSGTPAAPTAGTPDAPTGLRATPVDAGLSLAWTAPSGTLTGYDLHYTSSTTVTDTVAASGSDPSAAWVADTFPPGPTSTFSDLSSLTNGTLYRVRLRAKNSTGAGAWAFTTGTPNIFLAWPGATHSQAEGITTAHQPRLTAGTITAAISYTLTYKAGATNPASLSADLTTGYATTFSESANQYAIPSVAVPVDDTVNEEHETFTVTINAGTGYLVGSPATLTFTITDNDPPAAPSGLSLTAGSGKLSASWTKPAGPVTGYQLRHKQTTAANQAATTPGDPSTGWVTSTPSGTTTSAEITGLTNGTAYHVQVRATDGQTESGNGYGAWSASQSGTPAAAALAAPTNLMVTAGNAQLSLTWTAPSGTVTGYDVHYTSALAATVTNSATASGNDPSAAWVAVNRTGTTASQTISSLSNGTVYRVRVRAKNSDTSSAWVFGTGTPVAPAVPAAPTGLSVTAGNAQLSLTWTAPAGTLTGYDVHYTSANTATVTNSATASGNDASAAWVAVSRTETSPPTASQTISSLDNGTAYRVRVRAKNANGAGAWVFGSGTPALPPPAAPTGLSVTAGNAQLSLTWTAPSGTLTGYDVHYTSAVAGTVANDAAASGNDPSAAWVAVNRTGTTASQTISSLSNGTAYRVRVRAKNVGGAGAWVFGTGTPVLPPPAAPTNLAVEALSTILDLSWTAPSGTLTGYDVHYTSALVATVANDAAASGNNPSAAWVADARGTENTPPTASERITSLTNGTAYRVRVRAKNSAGAGAWVFGTGTPVAVTPPGVPRNVTIAPGNNAVTLSWQAPASWGDWTASRFEIREFVTDTSGGQWFVQSVGTRSTTIQRGAHGSGHYASNGQTETWKIRALSQKPGSDGSKGEHYQRGAWVTVTVTVGVPAVPTGLSATPGNGKLDLRWTAPAQNGAAISGYDVHYTSAASGTVTNSAAASGSDPSAAWVNTSHSGTTATQTISSLANDGTTYRWRVRAKNSIGAGGWAFGTGTMRIGVSLSAAPNPVTEGADVTVTATLLASGAAVTIPVTVSTSGSNTAEPGDVGTLTGIAVAAGQTTGTGTVATNSDTDTLDETFTVALNTATLPSAYLATGTTSVQVTITDNNMPKVSLSASPDPVAEGSDVTVTATLSSPISSEVTIPVTIDTSGSNTAEPGDVGTLASITISAEKTTGTGTITTNQDTDTLDETFTVSLGTLPSAVTQGSPASVEVTIDDDDMPTVSLSASSATVVEGSSVTVTATLSSAISGEVTIPVTVSTSGSNTAEPGDVGTLASITIAAEQTTGTGAIATNEDTDTLDETFTVSLGTLPTEVTAGSPSSVTVAIDDNDMPTVSLSVDLNRPTEGESVTVTVTLSSPISGAVAIPLTVTLGTAESGDITAPASITVAARQTTGTGTIRTHQDGGHMDETFTVSLGTLPTEVTQGSPSSVTVTIRDDERRIRVSLTPTRITVNEGQSFDLGLTFSRPPDDKYGFFWLISEDRCTYKRYHDLVSGISLDFDGRAHRATKYNINTGNVSEDTVCTIKIDDDKLPDEYVVGAGRTATVTILYVPDTKDDGDDPPPEDRQSPPDTGGSAPGDTPGGGGGTPSGGGGGGGAPPTGGDSPLPEEPEEPEQTDECGEDDRENLVSFYEATGGDSWLQNTDWNSEEPLREWHGVNTEDGEVVSLRLADNNLSGDMPTEELLCLNEDTEIKELALWGNDGLLGEVPDELARAVERAVLRDVAEALELNTEWFDDYEDPFSFGDWHSGVTTDDDGRVTELDFTGEDIEGEIPGRVFEELRRLRVIKTGCGVTLEVEAPERVSVTMPDDCPEETAPEDMEEMDGEGEEPEVSGGGGCALGQGDSSLPGFGLLLATLLVFAALGRRRAQGL